MSIPLESSIKQAQLYTNSDRLTSQALNSQGIPKGAHDDHCPPLGSGMLKKEYNLTGFNHQKSATQNAEQHRLNPLAFPTILPI